VVAPTSRKREQSKESEISRKYIFSSTQELTAWGSKGNNWIFLANF
jgi:hypothetical protein